MTVGAVVALDAHGADVGQQHHRELPNIAFQTRSVQLLADDGVRRP